MLVDRKTPLWVTKIQAAMAKLLLLGPLIVLVLIISDEVWSGSHYREIHESLDKGIIKKAVLERYSGNSLVISSPGHLGALGKLMVQTKLKGYIKTLSTRCYLNVELKNKKSIKYYVLFDFTRKNIKLSIQGNKGHTIGGISMGYYEEPRSDMINWLTHEMGPEGNPEDLAWCTDYQTRKKVTHNFHGDVGLQLINYLWTD